MSDIAAKQMTNKIETHTSDYPYYIENPLKEHRVERFLEVFAAVLSYTDYKPLLDSYCTTNTKCNRCAVACPIFITTGNPKDIPCYKTNLLLNVYKRYFTIGGWFESRFSLKSFELTEDIIDEVPFHEALPREVCEAEVIYSG